MIGRSIGTIPRNSLREELHGRIREEIANGGIPPSSRVNEADLARLAGVSRTPVREALLLLEAEGFVRSDTGRGFYTSPLTIDEAAEIYPILAGLECLALRFSGPPDSDTLDRLEALNAELEQVAADSHRSLELDSKWHARLLSGCGNRRLLLEIQRMKAQLRRYERAYMRDNDRVATSIRQHADIITALRSNRMAAASEALERNWSVTFERLAPWLRDREESSSVG